MKAYGFILLAIALAPVISCSAPGADKSVDSYPPIWPDYVGVTVPPTIAPLNFSVAEGLGSEGVAVSVSDESGAELISRSDKETIKFPIRKWHKVLKSNEGKTLSFAVNIKKDGAWTAYKPFSVEISSDPIDYGLTYRLIKAGYQSFGHMGIFERNLSNFRQKTILDNKMFDAGCLNCHTSNRTDPSSYSLHIRGDHSATLLTRDGQTECLNTITDETGGFFVYPSWHPSGKYIAYSVNKTRLSFYTHTDKKLEVYDQASDLIVYKPETHEVILSDLVRRKDKFENYPSFSADGSEIYFVSSEAGELPKEMSGNQYSLCKIAFDAEAGRFGDKVDTLVNGPALGMSINTPRPSYDGRFVMVATMDFGTFPIWHPEADLWLYDIKTGDFRPIEEINSDGPDSFHNWSSSSRWVVFTTRRDNSLYTLLYIAHMDENGHFGRPFLLPQRNPSKYYDQLMYSFNTPDFTSASVDLNPRAARKMLLSTDRTRVHVR